MTGIYVILVFQNHEHGLRNHSLHTLETENGPIPISKFLKFLDGKAGQGKTFLINAICHTIHAAKRIVLPCGTTALAALFSRADLICESILIIWNKLPMVNKAILESMDLLLRQICGKDKPFGGKLFIGAGDFRQVAPVVKGAGKSATINTSIKTSYMWTYFDKHILNQPIRNATNSDFAEFVDAIRNN
ncbi:3285_t:CDS:2 [Racocetra persica]|uniref:3285_t:CDS:1 n=1 Tax=Racocetra persica TaxID=160502 RepID=A0ACA9LNE0_9GLOM|nr:3285_t:CDS:2 [Racocetra persica]